MQSKGIPFEQLVSRSKALCMELVKRATLGEQEACNQALTVIGMCEIAVQSSQKAINSDMLRQAQNSMRELEALPSEGSAREVRAAAKEVLAAAERLLFFKGIKVDLLV